MMIWEGSAGSEPALVLFDSSNERLRSLIRRLVRLNPAGAVRCISLWDLRRLDDVPTFDRREILGRLRIELPSSSALEGSQAVAWIEEKLTQAASPEVELAAA